MADMTLTNDDAPYGFCPRCGVKGKTRERRPHGNDSCFSGHVYRSAEALRARPTDLATLLRHRIQRMEDSRADLARDGDSAYNDGYLCATTDILADLRFILNEASDSNRLDVLEREVRRLNNAIRHMREENSSDRFTGA